jgi:hypothetical protein
VQIGSAIYHSGFTLIMIAAAMTPMLCTMSPKMCTTAALTFMLSPTSSFFSFFSLCYFINFSLWSNSVTSPAGTLLGLSAEFGVCCWMNLFWSSYSHSPWHDSMSSSTFESIVYSYLMHLCAYEGWYTAIKLFERDLYDLVVKFDAYI